VLYSFKDGPGDGQYPTQAGLLNVNGTLYGTTSNGGSGSCKHGCGTVFSIATSGKETVLHSFGGSGDGRYPYGGLVDVNGTLYGTTSNCCYGPCLRYRDAHRCGTVFSITPSGTETILYSFGGSENGRFPYASLINVSGRLYSTTTSGGANGFGPGSVGDGTVFSIAP